MTSVGTIVGGLSLILLAGIFNGSWNASFSPKLNLAVGQSEPQNNNDSNNKNEQRPPPTPINDLTYHHAYALFQIYAALINIPICIFWAGGFVRVHAILSEVRPLSIILVVVFSLIWGVGTLLFGLACKIAGVGMGTNLSIGIVAVIGTFLPLITEQTLISVAGGVICVGLTICCVGLWIAVRALSERDGDECSVAMVTMVEKSDDDNDNDDDNDESKQNDGVTNELVESTTTKLRDADTDDTDHTPDAITITGKAQNELRTSWYLGLRRLSAQFTKSPSRRKQEEEQYPTWKKVGICVATGICASQLQFAFIFGQEITDLSLASSPSLPGSTHESGGVAIIWLLAISLGAPVAIVNGILTSPVPLSSAIRTPLSRHLKLICTTSIPWVAHIHIYGVCATTLLPQKVAASIGWPMLMMVTIGQSIILSIFLGEWKVASKSTMRTLKCSLLTTVVGIAILMSTVAIPE